MGLYGRMAVYGAFGISVPAFGESAAGGLYLRVFAANEISSAKRRARDLRVMLVLSSMLSADLFRRHDEAAAHQQLANSRYYNYSELIGISDGQRRRGMNQDIYVFATRHPPDLQ